MRNNSRSNGLVIFKKRLPPHAQPKPQHRRFLVCRSVERDFKNGGLMEKNQFLDDSTDLNTFLAEIGRRV